MPEPQSQKSKPKYKYTTLPTYFAQDSPSTDPLTFDILDTKTAFGILPPHPADPTSAAAWTALGQSLTERNRRENASGVVYKVLYLARHGEGEHNVAERRYGREAWDNHWSHLEGDAHATWADALLTPTGSSQAQRLSLRWKALMEEWVLLPRSFYCSPLRRCLQTCNITWGTLRLPASEDGKGGFKVLIKEGLREVMGVHTCDRRSSKAEIEGFFAEWSESGQMVFEAGFAEEDELWEVDRRESDADIDSRVREALDEIFAVDGEEIVSITSHSGTTASILRVLGHREFDLGTGGMIPVVVRAERVG